MRKFISTLCALLALALGACARQPEACPATSLDDAVHVVLTFDDGPIAADIADPQQADAPTLLQPLHQILGTLEARRMRAVFYIKGPGYPQAEAALNPAIRDGLLAMWSAGHVIGYHAYNHDPAIWAVDFIPASLEGRAREDLDAFQAYLDRLLDGTGTNQIAMFAPLFRQPYGGAGINQLAVEKVVAERGWIYHGFLIDSFDWLVNADSDPNLLAAYHVDSPEDHVDFVRRRLTSGAHRMSTAGVVDILFHVNAVTGEHLDEWISTLQDGFAAEGRAVVFDVPDCYLNNADPRVDDAAFAELIVPN